MTVEGDLMLIEYIIYNIYIIYNSVKNVKNAIKIVVSFKVIH